MPALPYGAPLTGPGPVTGRRPGRPGGWAGAARGARAHADRADPGAAAAVRDAEGLVEVEVADVGAELPGPGQADQGVEVGAVDVDLAAGLVHARADVGDRVLEHPVRARVGDHQRGQARPVLGHLGLEVVDVDVTGGGRPDDDDPHAGHHRARGVGAVRAARDQADVALGVAVGLVVAADRQQAGQLALAAGVGLQADGVVAGDLGQPAGQVVGQLPVAAGVGGVGERVQPGELRPGDRLHLGRRVELHRAGAQRDHRPVEGEVGVGQPAQVAQHRGLAVVGAEHLVREVRRACGQRGRAARPGSAASSASQSCAPSAERRGDRVELDPGRRLVGADAERVLVDPAQLDAVGDGRRGDLGRPAGHPRP